MYADDVKTYFMEFVEKDKQEHPDARRDLYMLALEETALVLKGIQEETDKLEYAVVTSANDVSYVPDGYTSTELVHVFAYTQTCMKCNDRDFLLVPTDLTQLCLAIYRGKESEIQVLLQEYRRSEDTLGALTRRYKDLYGAAAKISDAVFKAWLALNK